MMVGGHVGQRLAAIRHRVNGTPTLLPPDPGKLGTALLSVNHGLVSSEGTCCFQ